MMPQNNEAGYRSILYGGKETFSPDGGVRIQ